MKTRWLAALLALLAWPSPGQAQTPAAGGTVSLLVSEGRLLRLNHAATNVFVGDSSIADVQVVSPTTVYVYGRKPGQTTLSATDTGSNTTAQLNLWVKRSGAAAQADLGGGGVSLSFQGNRMVLRGPVGNLGEALDANAAARAYNGAPGQIPLDESKLAGAQQVTLRVRIAEVSRTDLDQLGVNFNVLARPGSFAFSLITGTFLNGAASSGIGSSLSGIGGSGNNFGALGGGVVTSRVNADALLNALQSEGVLTLLAEPNLTTISGETASFLAGGEVAIPVPQSFGVTTIEYKQYGVQLSFTPTLLPGDRIAMRVEPEVSEISNANGTSLNGTVVPGFISRKAKTSVEMASGQTLAIAGLLQRTGQDTLVRFPFLGDIPILGALFRSSRYQRDQTELVILVTPYLSQSVSSTESTALPTDRYGTGPTAPQPVALGGFAVE